MEEPLSITFVLSSVLQLTIQFCLGARMKIPTQDVTVTTTLILIFSPPSLPIMLPEYVKLWNQTEETSLPPLPTQHQQKPVEASSAVVSYDQCTGRILHTKYTPKQTVPTNRVLSQSTDSAHLIVCGMSGIEVLTVST